MFKIHKHDTVCNAYTITEAKHTAYDHSRRLLAIGADDSINKTLNRCGN